MSNSIRKALLRGVGFAAASGALLASPSFAGTEPGAEQLRLETQTAQAAPATEVNDPTFISGDVSVGFGPAAVLPLMLVTLPLCTWRGV